MKHKAETVTITTGRATYSLSIMMADAPPPPLHIDATPFCPGCKAWARWVTIRAPDILDVKHLESIMVTTNITDKIWDKIIRTTLSVAKGEKR